LPERSYAHRDVLDKLGLLPGQAAALDERAGPLEAELRSRALERIGRPLAVDEEPIDIVLATVTAESDTAGLLAEWRARISPAGAIWLLSPKRGGAGYVNQTVLINAGQRAGVVDNKVCSVSDTTSAMRFVLRRSERGVPGRG
jgi:hypothetical protein